MWCERAGVSTKERVQDLITYFEGTCEFCIGNMGMDSYREEVTELIEKDTTLDDETVMMLYYAGSVIDYKVENFADALEKWKKAGELAKKTGNEVYLAKVYSYISIYYYVKKEMEKSREYFGKALQIFKCHKLYSEIALHYINILWYKRYEEDKSEVLDYLSEALRYVQISDAQTDARVYLHIGYIYKTIFNDFITGFKHLKIAREMCCKNGNREMECMTFHVLADGYMQLGSYGRAVEIYRDILKMKEYRNITVNLKCMILSNLIPAYLHLGKYEEAEREIDLMDSYVPQAQVNIREQFEGTAKWLRARQYIVCKEKLEEAEALLEECERFAEKYANSFFVEAFDFQLAGSFGDLRMVQNDLEGALRHYKEQVALSEKYGLLPKVQAAGNLSDAYERLGDYKEALRYRKTKMEYVESIEHERLMNHYDRLYQELFKDVQEEHLHQLNKEKKKLEMSVFIDRLTGLPDRRCFDGYLKTLRQQGGMKQLGIIFCDIDFFKKYNDGFGHLKGDECLQKMGKLLQGFVKDKKARAFRYGGEEFILVLTGYEKEEILSMGILLAEQVRQLRIEHPWSTAGATLTVSVGCSTSSEEVQDIFELIRQADEALYHVKENGRNGAWMY